MDTPFAHYQPFWTRGIPVDVLAKDQDLSGYKLIIAPMLYMVPDAVGERITQFVEAGGTFVATYLSGLVNENDLCHLGGFPGPLRDVLGIWAEETDVFYEHQPQAIRMDADNPLGLAGTYAVRHYADIIHLEGAESLAAYTHDFYAGRPALTVHARGAGRAYYVASRNEPRFLADFYAALADQLALTRSLPADLPPGVTAQTRTDGQRTFVFLLNFTPEPRSVDVSAADFRNLLSGEPVGDTCTLEAYGVAVLECT